MLSWVSSLIHSPAGLPVASEDADGFVFQAAEDGWLCLDPEPAVARHAAAEGSPTVNAVLLSSPPSKPSRQELRHSSKKQTNAAHHEKPQDLLSKLKERELTERKLRKLGRRGHGNGGKGRGSLSREPKGGRAVIGGIGFAGTMQ